MVLPQLPKLPRLNGDVNEKNRIIKNIETPEEERDAVNKKWAEDTFVAI